MIFKSAVLRKVQPKVQFSLSDRQASLLVPIGDIHYGDHAFPKKHFKDHIKWCVDRGAYFLGMGDYLDLGSESQRKIIAGLRESTREQLDEKIMIQAAELVDLLEPTRGRWLGMLRGNHSWDFLDATCVEQFLCAFMGRGCDFLGDSALIRLISGKGPEGDTIVCCHHGKGSSQTIGGQLNKPEQLLKYVSADLILMGHSHAKLVGSIDKINITPDGVMFHRTTLVARTGAFLKAYEGREPLPLKEPAYLSGGSYVERGAMMPSSMGGICFSIGTAGIDGSKYYRPVLHYSV